MSILSRADRDKHLPSGARLKSEESGRTYRICGKKLRKAGIGFLYRAEALDNEGVTVLIKEYFPVDIADRASKKAQGVVPWNASARDAFEKYRESFLEAGNAMQRAAEEDNEFLLPLVDVFGANDTIYAVWDLPPDFDEASEPGGKWDFETLESWGSKQKAPERRKHAHEFLHGLLSGLETLRSQGAVHLNLKPSNIFMFAGKPVIADFGLPDWYTDPFAAPEQDLAIDNPGCEADVYGLGATIVSYLLGFGDGDAAHEHESILISGSRRESLDRSKRPDPIERWLEELQASELLDEETCAQLRRCLSLDPAQRLTGSGSAAPQRAFDDPKFSVPPLQIKDELLRWVEGEHCVYRFGADHKKYIGLLETPGSGIRYCGATPDGDLLVVPLLGAAQVWNQSTEGGYELRSPDFEVKYAEIETETGAFDISVATITVGEYLAAADQREKDFRRENRLDAGGDGLPVTNVTFDEVQKFLQRLNEAGDGYQYRLPTEPEWEAAACVADSAAYPWGDSPEEASHFAQFHCEDGPVDADEFSDAANPNGLINIVGNVWEWTQSPWSEDRDTTSTESSAREKHLVLRGGGWLSTVEDIRLESRAQGARQFRYPTVGFRMVREKDKTLSIHTSTS